MIETVHVVFKTHLDLGFTDTAASVTANYVHEYLPRAIALSQELERRGGPAQFVWTTGSWLIHEALRLGSEDERTALAEGIRRGYVRWHGLPLTMHTELLDEGMVEHAISIGRALDERFGMHTIAAKMTDVPGHTLGLVPVLARGGIEYLHLGVNGASAVPEVPELFIWRAPDGSEVVVNYAKGYGATEHGVALAPGGTEAMHLAHTGDNFGPPSAEEVQELFAELIAAYPGANVIASTLDAFATAVLKDRASLPVIEEEIGDSWIYGAGSDPLQTARLRELLRLRTHWVATGELVPGEQECDAFSDGLLLVAEHTWGKDLKTYLPDYVNYEEADFQRARAAVRIDPGANPAEFENYAWAYAETQARPEGLSYSGFEASWAEQRGHIDRALSALGPERQAAAQATLDALRPEPGGAGGDPNAVAMDLEAEHAVVGYRVRFGADGSIVSLVDGQGAQWAGPDHALASYRYQTFDERDEARWVGEYCRNLQENACWAIPDQAKPGLAIAETLPATVFAPSVVSAERYDDGGATIVRLKLQLPEAACESWGAARNITLAYRFAQAPDPIEVILELCKKDASRLPEASWLGFRPRTDPGRWSLTKLGSPVDPRAVVSRGNRNLHAVSAVTHTAARKFTMSPLDAPLVAVGAPGLMRFADTVPEPEDGFHVNLHNNVWGTNFTMWFEDDMRYRFILDLGEQDQEGDK